MTRAVRHHTRRTARKMASPRLSPMKLRLLLLSLLPAFSVAHAGLSDPLGVWQLDAGFSGMLPSHTALDASSLSAGVEYSFGSDGAGYQFLQTQPFSTPSKRLTVTNPAGPNGGPAATRTNQWTMVMDVKLDGMQPYAGLIQLNPLNNIDVTIYVGSPNNVTGTLQPALSAAGAIAVGTWYRLAITCGNNGAGGISTQKVYLNGVPNGTPRTAAFDGTFGLQSVFHLFSDETFGGGDLKPAKLGSFALWGEELSAADIATLGAPQPNGIRPPGLAVPSTIASASPYAWGANLGWIHAKPATAGLVIGEYACSGYAHSANCGWIHFGDGSPANGIRYGNTDGADSGVNHDGAGNLSGLAWGANIGWINFGIDATGSPRALGDPDRPRLNLTTGQFSGYAHGANVGWINLSALKTESLYSIDDDGDEIADAWEREKFSNLTAATGTTDADKDGVSDKDEYLADTNPNDSSSRLRIVNQLVQFFPNDGLNTWDVTFTSSPRRLYRFETSSNPGTVAWFDETGPFPGSSGATTALGIEVSTAPRNFLRVQAVKPLQP